MHCGHPWLYEAVLHTGLCPDAAAMGFWSTEGGYRMKCERCTCAGTDACMSAAAVASCHLLWHHHHTHWHASCVSVS